MPRFVPGLSLAASTYHEAVRPILDVAFPGLAHSAALLGPGSEVLGFDTARSTDHDWGPRLLLFLQPADARRHARDLSSVLAERMPASVQGWSTNFSPPEPGRSRTLRPADDAPIQHRVEVLDLDIWLADRLGVDPRRGMCARDWLAIPTQLGTAFSRLRCAPTLRPLLADAVAAAEWPHREAALCAAYEHLARAHNDLGLGDPVEPTVRPFHDRPFRVLGADRFADAARRAVTDPEVLALPPHIGGVDQFVDSTDVLSSAARARAATVALHGTGSS